VNAASGVGDPQMKLLMNTPSPCELYGEARKDVMDFMIVVEVGAESKLYFAFNFIA